MKRMLLTILGLLLLLGAGSEAELYAQYTGVVTVDSGQARPSETIALKVWLRDNNIDISAISIPLKFSSSALTLDSVSWASSIWGESFSGYSVVDNSAGTVMITVLPDDIIFPLPSVSFVEGVVAELFFHVNPSAGPQRAAIDSIYADTLLFGDVHIYTRIDVTDNSGTVVYVPDFEPGDIDILVPTAIEDDPEFALPTQFELVQNYPNPFNPSTLISFAVPIGGAVRLDVFNILGQEVATLTNSYREAGVYTVEFNGTDYPSGIYFYRLQHDGQSATRKMMLVK